MATILFIASLTVSIAASAHAILYKRDVRAAIGWIGLIWLSFGLGVVLYLLLGVNRIRRKAATLRGDRGPNLQFGSNIGAGLEKPAGISPHLHTLVTACSRANPRRLWSGNRAKALFCGDEAYPAMLAAVDSASQSVTLCSYIFTFDRVGALFVEALCRAKSRGVQVRVLIDDIGSMYSRSPVRKELEKAGVPVAHFLPPWRVGSLPFFNLRNHRKLLIIDGKIAFCGGMNIHEGHQLSLKPENPVTDIHFRIEGPVVEDLQTVFKEDWEFTTGEELSGNAWFSPRSETDGHALARAIPDGPDHNAERITWVLLAALATARERVRIVTPYFIPSLSVISALNTAALQGVRVEIVVPEKSDQPWVDWAARAQFWQMLERGCRIWLSPGPFDHSKLMLVDSEWVLVGSSNWDARSLRLNFELNVEIYDRDLAKTLEDRTDEILSRSREVTLEEMDDRMLLVRLRDGFFRLFAPYL